ncbi:hypothetical protein [Candidatus Nitronereus thalassa]|uniref:Uncharacterized protein n=1 Tax=Candidatus Nitronereus thalassa TaxID=3020898 RepID=A0ABU3K6R9_9BACT|nr:hypothetical protein [Candidatus Nitronereus thalassa]MDT7042130.1 hypothetical protein [Candidatus Nitronereus thalassa]
MKKIKRKSKTSPRRRPSFVVGFSGDEYPPPGFFAGWFDQQYGGPLHIRFLDSDSHDAIEARHVDWQAKITLVRSDEEVSRWQDQVGWEHAQVVEVVSTSPVGSMKQDVVLFLSRLARGLTLLTDGTAYDVIAGRHFNPSDWSDCSLNDFHIGDHVCIKEEEHMLDGRQWLHTRGLAKFGLEEFEVFLPRGLSSSAAIDRLLDLSVHCISQGKSPKVGERVYLVSNALDIQVVHHRTHPCSDGQLNLRQVEWDH